MEDVKCFSFIIFMIDDRFTMKFFYNLKYFVLLYFVKLYYIIPKYGII